MTLPYIASRFIRVIITSSYLPRVTSSCITRVTSSRNISGRRKRQLASIPTNTPSSSHMAGMIRRRLDDSLKEDILHSEHTDNFTLESMAAEKFYQSNKDKFEQITLRRELAKKHQVVSKINDKNTEVDLALKEVDISDKWSDGDIIEDGSSSLVGVNTNDRGFYVEGDRFTDEYTAASLFDFPEDVMNSCVTRTTRYGPQDAVEEIEFQHPGQSTNLEDDVGLISEEGDSNEWMERYGSVDASISSSNKSCTGCGANFHCKNASLPGFLPVELFSKLDKKGNQEALCRRCYLLDKHNFLLNMNVCEVDYITMMSHLKLKQEALIVLVVDMTDLPASIYTRLPDIIGDTKPMIVVGNKVDLLPPDQRSGYLKHFRDTLYKEVHQLGFAHRFNIIHTALISAKTGFGVEQLITNIFLQWSSRGSSVKNDIYLVGCTNAGKSTLFNTLLQSDMCKVRAVDLVQRATTSIWPGTTISLLKFPVINPTPHKLELRRRRLLSNQAWILKERRLRKEMLEDTGEPKYATLQAHVGNTFKETEQGLQPVSMRDIECDSEELDKTSSRQIWNPEDEVFAKGNWCYDTPGTVNQQQVLNLLTLDELIAVQPRRMLEPRTFLVYPGDSIVVAAVARIDLIRVHSITHTPVYLTVFASDMLPVHVMKTCEVDQFMSKYRGTAALVVPKGDTNRLNNFPKLEGGDMTIQGLGMDKGAADVILSSIGWICVTGDRTSIVLRAYTPGSKGLSLRQPPILPFCAKLRGSRVAGTAAYRVKPVQLPINERRLRREKEDHQLRKDKRQREVGNRDRSHI